LKARLFGLGLGGNTPDTPECLATAARYLRDFVKTEDLRFSSVYRTPPWGNVQGGEFMNCVAVGRWQASDRALLKACRKMEALCGVPVNKQGAARSLDVDVLFLEGGESVEDMIIPHPRMHLRRFVLVPLAEVLSEPVPGLGLTPQALLERTEDDARIAVLQGAAFV
jgi:2-amino-4-hydroxy-6-hydroxymethyldihydropteridine diphosphokinase